MFLAISGAALIGLRAFFDLVAREYALYRLESDRLIFERGLISHRRWVIPLDVGHLQRVYARQSFLGRLGNYGDIMISTAGLGWVSLRRLENPFAWQEELLRRVSGPAQFPDLTQPPIGLVSRSPVRGLTCAVATLLFAVCAGSTLLSTVSIHPAIVAPIPTPTPSASIFSGMNITTGDILKSMWMLYQIPTIFWLVNLIIIASIATSIMEAVGRRRVKEKIWGQLIIEGPRRRATNQRFVSLAPDARHQIGRNSGIHRNQLIRPPSVWFACLFEAIPPS